MSVAPDRVTSGRESRVVAFLAGRGPDGSGRRIETVLGLEDEDLERLHDYIQWLFPLLEASQAVPGSPVLSSADIEAITRDGSALRNIDRATTVMQGFYARTTHWLVPHDHNHLRITRISKSLRLLRGAEPAQRFGQAILHRVAATRAPVSARSLAFWSEAMEPRGC